MPASANKKLLRTNEKELITHIKKTKFCTNLSNKILVILQYVCAKLQLFRKL